MPTLESIRMHLYHTFLQSYHIIYHAICIIIFDETVFDIILYYYRRERGKDQKQSVGNLNDFELFRGIQ